MNNFDEFDDIDDKDKTDTENSYDDFEGNDNKKSIVPIIIVAVIIILILLIIWGLYSSSKKKSTTDPIENTVTMQESIVFELNGEEKVTLAVGEEFVDPGCYAQSSTNGSLTSFVETSGEVDTSTVGVYKITYTLIYGGNTRELVRTVEVTLDGESSSSSEENNGEDTGNKDIVNTTVSISLNGSPSIYVFRGVAFQDPGASAVNQDSVDISSSITKTGNVNTSSVGTYTITYSIANSSNQVKSVSRQVHVVDMSATITPSTKYYTNSDVDLTINVSADNFSYIILPNGQKITQSSYSYKVTSNQSYSFQVYNGYGLGKKYTYTVKNIDKENPTGSCTVSHGEKGSEITITANDNIGISAYGYNDKKYKSNVLTFGGYFKEGTSVSVGFYDKAGNYGTATCTAPAR